jgi:predicted RNA-binding protein with RPS1 domain
VVVVTPLNAMVLQPPDAATELRGLLRETIEVARDAAHALEDNTNVSGIVKAYLGMLAVEEKRKNDLSQRQLELEEKRQANEDRRRHESSDERKIRLAEKSRWQQTLIETGQKAGEGICKILDSRWSTLGVVGLLALQWIGWWAGWLPGEHPPLPPGFQSIESHGDPSSTPSGGADPAHPSPSALPATPDPVHDSPREPP